FTGFQKVSAQTNKYGGLFEFDAPSAGTHPLFGGFDTGTAFTVLSIDNVPSTMTLDFDTRGHAKFDAAASPGTIHLYQGPLPMANDGDSATRLVINDTPSMMHAGWSFDSSNGGAFFHASNKFEILMLTQNDSTRIVAAAGLQDLAFGYQLKILSFDV